MAHITLICNKEAEFQGLLDTMRNDTYDLHQLSKDQDKAVGLALKLDIDWSDQKTAIPGDVQNLVTIHRAKPQALYGTRNMTQALADATNLLDNGSCSNTQARALERETNLPASPATQAPDGGNANAADGGSATDQVSSITRKAVDTTVTP